jgi:ribosomal-protein-serine acetyltransferase
MNSILFDFPDRFETERLLLRSPQPGDGRTVMEAIEESHQTLKKWMKFAQHIPTIEESEERARLSWINFLKREDLQLLIFDKTSKAFLGSTGLHRIDWNVRKFEIGYWIRDSASGKGYVSEAVQGVTQFAAEYLNANRIEIRCDVMNSASRKVAERCGYHLEAIFLKSFVAPDGSLRDDCIYSKVRLEDGTLGYPVIKETEV